MSSALLAKSLVGRQGAETAAIEEWSQSLGQENVATAGETRDIYARTTLPQGTRPLAVLRPGSVEDVQQIVRIAAQRGVAVYPISRGKNWGLGDACAVGDGQAIIDLGRLNRIVEVNERLGYAVVEAGVTQGQLHGFLQDHGIPLWLDATGAGPDASIVGNIMERGYGHTPHGDRFQNSCTYEVVLPDGRLLRTGFGHYEAAQAKNVFKPGIGPALDGLFTQSNLGIVTRLTVWLMPEPPCFEAFVLTSPREDDLGQIVEALRPLKMLGILQSAIHIANDLRVYSGRHGYPWDLTGGAAPIPNSVRHELRRKHGLGAWHVLGGIYGTKESVRATKKNIAQALRGRGKLRFVCDWKLRALERLVSVTRRFGGARFGAAKRLSEILASIRPAYALLKGEPVKDHLTGTSWRSPTCNPCDLRDPLAKCDGLMWITPVIPMLGENAEKLVNLAEPILRRSGFDLLITFVMVNSRAMCCPLTICYNKRDREETARAKACYESLFETLMAEGYIPYRSGIQSMQDLGAGSSVFWDVVRELKHALDPGELLAPGRYLPFEE